MLFTVSTFLLADQSQRDQPRVLAEERSETSPTNSAVKIRVYENSANQRVAVSVAVHLHKWNVYSLFLPVLIMGGLVVLAPMLSLLGVIEMGLLGYVGMCLWALLVSVIVVYGNLLLMKAQAKVWSKKRARAVLDGD